LGRAEIQVPRLQAHAIGKFGDPAALRAAAQTEEHPDGAAKNPAHRPAGVERGVRILEHHLHFL